MRLTRDVEDILKFYESDNPGSRSNLARILMNGKLGGSGKILILPVDQGFEHGPVRSFAVNPEAYDPNYHIELAIEAGLSAYAAPLGMIELIAHRYCNSIPLILKINSSNSLNSNNIPPYQSITANVKDALRLGYVAVGFTIYPGSDKISAMIKEAQEVISVAKTYGLATVIWSYPRGGNISKSGETAIDICAYAAHIAALIGAHIIKVKPPTDFIEQNEAKQIYENNNIPISTLEDRVSHIVQSCFNGKRIVIFSGGTSKSLDNLYNETRSIYQGGGYGSIIGRNSFQRPRDEALAMLDEIIDIYLGK